MRALSDDDVNLRDITPDELASAWDLWFDLAQATNDSDPPYTHGVFVGTRRVERTPVSDRKADDSATPSR